MDHLALRLALLLGLLPTPCFGAGEDFVPDPRVEARVAVGRAEEAAGKGQRARAGEEARRALELLAQADPREPAGREVPFLAVQAATLAGDESAARRWRDVLLSRTQAPGEDPDLRVLGALVHLRLEGRPDLAFDTLEELTRPGALAPGALAARLPLDLLAAEAVAAEAERRLAAEEYGALVALYRRAVEFARRRGDARMEVASLRNLGLAHQMNDEYAEAVDVFLGLRGREPGNPYWAWRTAVNLANHTRWAEAVPFYEEAIRLVEAGKGQAADLREMRPVHLRLANCRRILAGAAMDPRTRAELLEKARLGFARYIELVPKDPRGPYWMGVLLAEELERPYEALPFFQRAYALDPVCDASLRNLVQIRLRHPPPPGTSQEAWDAQRIAQEKDLAENAEERAKARRARERGPARDDGCE